jgi:hypothetical protein
MLPFAIATSPLWAQAHGGAVPKSLIEGESPGQHGPRKPYGPRSGQIGGKSISDVKTFMSNNWSGYAVIGSDFTQVRGSWIVPAVDCSGAANSSVSFWVGIDGWSSSTVEQTGTDSDCDGLTPTYYAWYQFYPRLGVTIASVSVKPGDQMSASVYYDGAKFFIEMTNQSTGESYGTSWEVPGAERNSAEWIAELNGSYGLADFGTVPFGVDFTGVNETNTAADSTASGPIGAFEKQVQESVMVSDRNVLLASPSSISADGTSFTVTWMSR